MHCFVVSAEKNNTTWCREPVYLSGNRKKVETGPTCKSLLKIKTLSMVLAYIASVEEREQQLEHVFFQIA